ncbi:MAG: hypothetical protein KJP23_16390 [Deltaproteobacteria bacterium]|nr:hypothetical protein [Deltaproteobacteria bacterium]
MKFLKYIILIALTICVAALPSPAEDTKGLKPMVCAAIETYDCGFGENCTRGSADDIDLPVFLNIKFEGKIITGTMDDGSVRTTKIQRMEQLAGGIIIQGIEDGLGFSLSYNTSTRKITGAVSGDQIGFVIFGACKPE